MPTLTLETNTYVTLAEAEAYFAAYPNDTWAGTDDEKGQALINATQSVDALYGAKYLSEIASNSQSLLFPRLQFYDQNRRLVSGIPTSLKNAVCELAVLAISGEDIFPQASTSQNVRDETITVGGISVSTTQYRPNEGESFEGFRKVDLMMRPLLTRAVTGWRLKA